MTDVCHISQLYKCNKLVNLDIATVLLPQCLQVLAQLVRVWSVHCK